MKKSRAYLWRLKRRFAISSRLIAERAAKWSASRRNKKRSSLQNHVTGELTTEPYDKLVLSPGAAPIRPPLPGIDLPGIFSVRTVPDARQMRAVA